MSHLFFFNDTATTEIYTLSLHDALPIYALRRALDRGAPHQGAVPLPREARERGDSVRRIGGEAEQLHPGGWGRAPDPSRPAGAGLQRALQPGGARPSLRRRV